MDFSALDARMGASTNAPATEFLGVEPLKKFQQSLAEMTTMIEQKMPELPRQLGILNELIRKHPEICHMLTEDEIHEFMRGVIPENQAQFALASTTGRSGKKNALKNVNWDMLGSGGNDVKI